MDDWSKDPEHAPWIDAVIGDMVPKLMNSAISVSIAPVGASPEGDVKYWVELGASIMLDKPILVVATPGAVLPERLRRVADRVVEVDLGSEEAADVVQGAVADMLRRFP